MSQYNGPAWMACLVLVICGMFVVQTSAKANFSSHSDGSDLQIDVSEYTGYYDIKVQNEIWLQNAEFFVYSNGAKFSYPNGNLKLVSSGETDDGEDAIGMFLQYSFTFRTNDSVYFTVSINVYTLLPVLIFTQTFLNATNTSASLTPDDVVSGFPSFLAPQGMKNPMGFLAFGGTNMGTSKLQIGQWPWSSVKNLGGINTGPLAIFDSGTRVMILSPFDQMMTSSLWVNETNSSMYWGLMGSLASVPAGYQSSVILFYSSGGITRAFHDFGKLMRKFYHKDCSVQETDVTLHYFGYATGNGSYFFSQPEKGKTFEQTVIDVRFSSLVQNISYSHMQLGSWWYVADANGGTVAWVPGNGTFPSGLPYLQSKTDWFFAAENGIWSSKNVYAKQNGGIYNFGISSAFAIPLDKIFWKDFFTIQKNWGLITYQQGMMDRQFTDTDVLLRDPYLAGDWLMQMGEAAKENALFIQYGSALSRQALQALKIPAVTQVKVGPDFSPGIFTWERSFGCLLASTLGLAPVINTFWTNSTQPGNPYGKTDPYIVLNSLAASLSTGPILPGDGIDGTNRTLLMRCCNSDGLILKPSTPLMMIDAMIQQMAIKKTLGPNGQVWAAVSNISGYRFGTIMAADMQDTYLLYPGMTILGFQDYDGVIMNSDFMGFPELSNFSQSDPLKLTTACSNSSPCLYHTAPTLGNIADFVFIYGELGKWVPMSNQRVTYLRKSHDEITLDLVGAVNETVTFLFYRNFSFNITITCSLGVTASVRMYYTQRICVPLSYRKRI